MRNTRETGKHYEDLALAHLKQQGMQLIKSNFECKTGEIDLIMKDQDYYVFVEVRYRAKGAYGGGIESVTAVKRRRIIKTASYYLVCNNLYDQVPCRFDVVAISDNNNVHWIANAFQT